MSITLSPVQDTIEALQAAEQAAAVPSKAIMAMVEAFKGERGIVCFKYNTDFEYQVAAMQLLLDAAWRDGYTIKAVLPAGTIHTIYLERVRESL